MPRNPAVAVVALRMAPSLRDALKAAAADAGCSINAYAVQVLASAAGDPARFRQPPPEQPNREDVAANRRALRRDKQGIPLDGWERQLHLGARQEFFWHMREQLAPGESTALIAQLDQEDPAHFVEWWLELKASREREGRGSSLHLAAG
jgi:hypothetical protein